METKAAHAAIFARQQDQIGILADRLTRLEAREDSVIAEAKEAASVAAIGAATAAMADIAGRAGVSKSGAAKMVVRGAVAISLE